MKRIGLVVSIVLIGIFNLGYAHALTPDQIIRLKKAGVSDQTIQMMLQQEREARQENPADSIGVKEVKDKDGNAVTVYTTGRTSKENGTPDAEDVKVDKAWKMLQNMIIDNRK
ncbi:MAG TPA: hypothetical protein VLZ07_01290 [Syntrophales bacterium]|nr:hypothetical protein [Syntrophales bacterium]